MQKKMIVIGVVAVMVGMVFTYGQANREQEENMQENIAEKVLRFHVLANSDSEEDQNLKLKVKDEVVEYLDRYLAEDSLSLEQTKEIIEEQKSQVIALAEHVIRENGYDYTVTADIEHTYFPVKAYGDVTLPAGEYEAFRIQIGNAQGKNWWCILYPPLCFVDASYGYVPDESKQTLKNVLDEDSYNVVTNGGNVTGQVEVRLKVVDWIKDKFCR